MKIIFICKANVGRSQIAQTFFSGLSGKHSAVSAGTHVGENENQPLHEFVIKCMSEAGYDVSKNVRKQLTEKMVDGADKIVVMTEKENLPSYIDAKKVAFWDVEDGKNQSLTFHRRMREEIKKLVEKLVEEIG